MAELHAQMHACHPTHLPAQRERLREKIQNARPLSDAMKQTTLTALAQLPEDTALCHGDFHPDNIVLSARGPVILDWTDATCGHPLADVARTALLMQHAALPPHIPGRRLIEIGRALWYRLYLRRYCELCSILPEDVKVWMLPVAAARLSEGIAEEEQQLVSLVTAMLTHTSA
jgi:aminoglycoside phosphotransferase (APT) family kinase protein